MNNPGFKEVSERSLTTTHRFLESLGQEKKELHFAEFLFVSCRGKQTVQLCDQATKCKRWMPWCQEAMKDVASCDKPREAASRR